MLTHVKFAELPVSNQDRAVKFYTEVLGLRVAQDGRYDDSWRWIELEFPGARTRLVMTRRKGEADGDTPSLVLIADDVQATCAAAKAKGVVFTREPQAAEWDPSQIYALFRDSEDNIIMIGSP